MPLGASRLNFLSKTLVAAGPAQRTARTVTAVNDAQIDTAQSKFGGSSYLGDGASDYLTVDVADFGSTVGSAGDFTIECFARTTNTANKGIFHIHADSDYNAATGANSIAAAFYSNGSAKWQIYFKGTSSQALGLTASTNSTNTWYHVAVVRYSGTMYLYIDGVQQWSSTDTYDYSSARYLQFGAYYTSAYSLPGNIDEFRISKTARYTSGFTPTTTAFVDDSDTLLLIHADGTDGDTVFIDDNGDRAPTGVAAIGNAQISTTQNKIGSKSLYFDGSGDYLKLWNPSISNWGTGDFTIEFWLKTSDTSVNIVANQNAGYDQGFTINNFGTQLRFYSYSLGTTVAFSPESIDYTDDTWHHVAIVRNSGSVTFYMDGTAGTAVSHTTSYSAILYDGAYCKVGVDLNGYIDELRISDTARYTSSFTAPTTAFTSDANTLVLLHAEEGANASTEIFDDNGGTLPS
jgi:hypothetical protein